MAITTADYDYGERITGNAPASSLSGFVALITSDCVDPTFFDNVENGGGDIRVSLNKNGDNQLPIQVEVCNTTGDILYLWVRFPTYSLLAREVYIFAGNSGQTQPAVTATYGRNNVWQDYLAVNHGRDLVNSTGGNNFTVLGTAPVAISQKHGSGWDFGTGNGLLLSSISAVAKPQFTMESFGGYKNNVLSPSGGDNNCGAVSLAVQNEAGGYDYTLSGYQSDTPFSRLDAVTPRSGTDNKLHANGSNKYQAGGYFALTRNSSSDNILYGFSNSSGAQESGTFNRVPNNPFDLDTFGIGGRADSSETYYKNVTVEARARIGVLSADHLASHASNYIDPASFWTRSGPFNPKGAAFQDTFTSSVDTLLTAHKPSFGTGWTLVSGNNDAWEIRASINEVRTVNSTRTLVTSDNLGSADCWVEAELTELSLSIRFVALRIQDANNFIGWYLGGSGGAGLRLVKCINGNLTNLITAQGVAGEVYRIEAEGSTIRFYRDGVQIGSDITETNFQTETSQGLIGDDSRAFIRFISTFNADVISGGGSISLSLDNIRIPNLLENVAVTPSLASLSLSNIINSVSISSAQLVENTPIILQNLISSVSLEDVTLVQHNNIDSLSISNPNTIRIPSLTEKGILTAININLGSILAQAGINQLSNIALQSVDNRNLLGNPVLISQGSLALSKIKNLNKIDNTTLSQLNILNPSKVIGENNLEGANFVSNSVLTPLRVSSENLVDLAVIASLSLLATSSVKNLAKISMPTLSLSGSINIAELRNRSNISLLDIRSNNPIGINGLGSSSTVGSASLLSDGVIDIDDISNVSVVKSTQVLVKYIINCNSILNQLSLDNSSIRAKDLIVSARIDLQNTVSIPNFSLDFVLVPNKVTNSTNIGVVLFGLIPELTSYLLSFSEESGSTINIIEIKFGEKLDG